MEVKLTSQFPKKFALQEQKLAVRYDGLFSLVKRIFHCALYKVERLRAGIAWKRELFYQVNRWIYYNNTAMEDGYNIERLLKIVYTVLSIFRVTRISVGKTSLLTCVSAPSCYHLCIKNYDIASRLR